MIVFTKINRINLIFNWIYYIVYNNIKISFRCLMSRYIASKNNKQIHQKIQQNLIECIKAQNK